MSIKVEKLNKGEEKETLKVFEVTLKSAFEEQGVGHLTEEIAKEIKNKEHRMEDFLGGKGEGVFLIAKLDGKIVGAISFCSCGEIIRECCHGEINPSGELGSLYVLPEYQNRGVGSKLINSLMVYLKEEGIEDFCLDSGFKKAQVKWTRKFGQPYKVMKDYWGPGVDHYIWYCNVKKESY